MLKEDDLITIRRHLHQIPEVALEEVETHAFLMQVIGMMDQKFLKSWSRKSFRLRYW